jgi:hypothetical protein
MDLQYFQKELNKYPVKRRSDYCKPRIVKAKAGTAAPKALTNSSSSHKTTPSVPDSKDLDFWDYVQSKLNADDLQLTAAEKRVFTKTLQDGHKATISKINLKDLEVMAELC